MKKLYAIIISGFILMSSCEKKDSSQEILGDESSKNNSAVISGILFGENSEPLADIWKIGEVVIENSQADFSADKVYFSRSSSSSPYVYWIIPVKNISDIAYAFVEATGIQFLDENGLAIYGDENDYTYVYGSCAENDFFMTSTFLKPDETGYLLGIEEVDFDQVKSIRLSTIDKSNSEFEYSDIKVVPLSYNVANDILNVTVKNAGNQTVTLTISPYLTLDDLYQPISWGFLSFDLEYIASETSIAPNSTKILIDDVYVSYTSRIIRPILQIDKYYGEVKSAMNQYIPFASEDAFIRFIKSNRDETLRNQENQVQ